MKRVLAVILALSVLLLWGCGKSEKTDKATTEATTAPAEPVLYDTGNFTVEVPGGWKAIPATDPFAEQPGTLDPDALHIGKGIENEAQLFTDPYVRVDYYGPDLEWYSPRDFYTTTEDLESFTTGQHTWEGFTVAEYGTVNAILVNQDDVHTFQVTVILENGDKKISLEDADVQQLLASITANQN